MSEFALGENVQKCAKKFWGVFCAFFCFRTCRESSVGDFVVLGGVRGVAGGSGGPGGSILAKMAKNGQKWPKWAPGPRGVKNGQNGHFGTAPGFF